MLKKSYSKHLPPLQVLLSLAGFHSKPWGEYAPNAGEIQEEEGAVLVSQSQDGLHHGVGDVQGMDNPWGGPASDVTCISHCVVQDMPSSEGC